MAISDDFSTDTSLNWTGFQCTGWSIGGGVLNAPSSITGNLGVVLHTASSTGSADQWVKVTLANLVTNKNCGPVVRHDNSTGNFYGFNIAPGETYVAIKIVSSNNTVDVTEVVKTGFSTWANGNSVGIKVTGTGTSTVFDIWQNPSGATPDDWGTPTASHTHGGVNPVADTGQYVGVGVYNVASAIDFDNFTADAYSAGTAYSLTADPGNFAFTVTDVALQSDLFTTGTYGEFLITGTDVTFSLIRNRTIVADPGSFPLTGTDSTLTASIAGGYSLVADPGSFPLTGTSVTLSTSIPAAPSLPQAYGGINFRLKLRYRIH